MTTLTEDIELPGGIDPATVTVRLELWGDGEPVTGYETSTGKTIAGPLQRTGNPWSIANVVGNADIDQPAGTVYRVVRTWPGLREPLVDYLDVPISGTVRVDQCLADPPGAIESSALALHKTYLHRPHVEIPPSWGRRWYQARTEAGARQVKVHLWGDSITQGVGATNQVTQGYAGLVSDALRTAYGDGGSGFLTHEVATKTGVWLTIEPFGVGMGGALGIAAAAATMQWTGLRGTRVRLFHRNGNITGSFRWRVDGGSWNTVTPPTGFGVEPGLAEVTGLADTPHTVDVEWLSGSAGIHGVLCDRPTGVVVARCTSGLAASQFSAVPLDTFDIGITSGSATITSTAPGRFDSSMIGQYLASTQGGLPFNAQVTAVASATSATIHTGASATGTITATLFDYPPTWRDASAQTLDPAFGTGLGRADLVVFAFGVNDLIGIRQNGATYRSGLARLLGPYYSGNSHTYSPDLVGIIQHRGDGFDFTGLYPELAGAVRDVARGLGGAVIDIWGIGRRSFKYWNDLGYFADGVHPSNTGHAQYAAPLIALLTGAAT